jgi:hypothetical protein
MYVGRLSADYSVGEISEQEVASIRSGATAEHEAILGLQRRLVVPHKILAIPRNDFEPLRIQTTKDDFFHDLNTLIVMLNGNHRPNSTLAPT